MKWEGLQSELWLTQSNPLPHRGRWLPLRAGSKITPAMLALGVDRAALYPLGQISHMGRADAWTKSPCC